MKTQKMTTQISVIRIRLPKDFIGFERPPQPLRASLSQNNPVNCCSLDKPALLLDKLSDKRRRDLRVNEYTA
jgi:hypothetical protein